MSKTRTENPRLAGRARRFRSGFAVTPRAALFLLASALASSSLSRPVLAQQQDAKSQARLHFQRGIELGGTGAYEESLREFSRAYELLPHFTVLYNIGQAHIALGHAADAVEVLKRYLAEGGANVALERRAQVEAQIIQQFARTAALELRVDAAGAQVTIDGTPRGRAPLPGPVRLDAGTHRVQVTLDSGEHQEQSLTLLAEQNQTLEFRLLAQANAPAIPPPVVPFPSASPLPASQSTPQPRPEPPAASPAVARGHRNTTLGIVLGAVGVGLGGAALAHYLWNRERYHDWQSEYAGYFEQPSPEKREEANRLAESIPRASAVTITLTIGAGLALGSGAFVLITDAGGGQATGSVVGWRGKW
ncbi:MAG TPA: PEGA domain-containing protein [Polyangiaceae bacterium]|jgi:hypothetical protein|nr:PEGA domain-containing protein [Polyangiaceae bacterium]